MECAPTPTVQNVSADSAVVLYGLVYTFLHVHAMQAAVEKMSANTAVVLYSSIYKFFARACHAGCR
jgi:hypothetical protein